MGEGQGESPQLTGRNTSTNPILTRTHSRARTHTRTHQFYQQVDLGLTSICGQFNKTTVSAYYNFPYVCLSQLANCRSQLLCDRLGRCLKLFVSIEITSSHKRNRVSVQPSIFYTRKTSKNYREFRVGENAEKHVQRNTHCIIIKPPEMNYKLSPCALQQQ